MPTATKQPTAAKQPITAETRFTITPAGQAALNASVQAAAPGACPLCGSALRVVNFYCGGVGYVPYDFCASAACSYQRRITR